MERIVDERKNNQNLMNKKSWFACDLIIRIFLRLPMKSLLWFRFVSKTWLAFICGPIFIKYHMSLEANNKDYTNHRFMLRTAHPENNLNS
ncbi:hypothetical protein R3W88_014877 [Solanum pinnatisectum]|uniref:F-box domain-containing protein n=1 Tax=Solanum pinnatisectum TaxID=50273 RepID=A0AAV9KVC1_9SOLN|nr:hypothetical protein R3W88_014877 [Solanum pinnatisectum]